METQERRVSQKSFEYSWPSEKPPEDVWREWVKKGSKLPQGSLSPQAIEQLTISGLSRHGQPVLENILRLKAPMAWQDIQTQVEKYLSTIYHQQSPQPMDISAVMTGAMCQSCGSQTRHRNDCWYKEETCKTCGKTRTGEGSVKGKGKKRTPETCLCCGKEGHKKTDCTFKTATCSNCGKVDHLRVVCRNTNTHESEKGADEPSPEVTVEAVWCKAVRDTVDDGHCDCIERHELSSEHRDESKLTEFAEHRDE